MGDRSCDAEEDGGGELWVQVGVGGLARACEYLWIVGARW